MLTTAVRVLRTVTVRDLSLTLYRAYYETNTGNRGANSNPKFRNSEVVRIPIRFLDGQKLTFFDNYGQTQHPETFSGKNVNYLYIYIYFFIKFYDYLFNYQNIKKSNGYACHILDINRIPIVYL